jgi:hypothetical protein
MSAITLEGKVLGGKRLLESILLMLHRNDTRDIF